MKFTKKALFTASLAMSAALMASAETVVLDAGASTTQDYLFRSGDEITFEISSTQTFSGRWLGCGVNYAASGLMNSWQALTGTTLTLDGGGTLRYEGFSDIDYYNYYYDFTSSTPQSSINNLYPSSLVVLSSDLLFPDADKSAYSGDLVITGGTTLEVYGFLTQYVRHYSNTTTTGKWVGVQSVTIDENSTISFKSSLNDFNFLKDVHASNNSVIELGGTSNTLRSDGIIHYSTAQLLITTSENVSSNIGILRGAGSVYFNNSGTVYFGAQAQFSTNVAASGDYYSSSSAPMNFDTQDWLDYVHSYTQLYDTTGESSTGTIADVYLAGGTFNLGLSETGEVVDNVFVSATALSLGMIKTPFLASVIVHGGIEEATSGNVASYTAYSDWTASPQTGTILNIYGTQIINNFESLTAAFNANSYFSRYGSIAESEADGTVSPYLYTAGTSFGSSQTVVLQADAILVLNQDKYRDGIFNGKFTAADADGDNVIIKTGEGNFVYRGTTSLGNDEIAVNRYYILEGGWYTTAAATNASTLVVGSAGTLVFFQNNASIFSGHISSEANAVLRISRSSMEKYYDDDEEAWAYRSTIANGRLNDSGKFEGHYIAVTSNSTTWSTDDSYSSSYGTNGYFEVKYTQDQFYGQVEVGAGITLILGSDVAENYANAFVNASKIILCGEDAGTNRSTVYLGGQNGDSAVQLMNLYYRDYKTDGSGTYEDIVGIGVNNRVVLNNWATLAWNVTETTSTKNLTGTAGALAKLNTGTLEIDEAVGYQGVTTVLNGTLQLNVQNALADSAGLILAGGKETEYGIQVGAYGSVNASSDQMFGGLVGGSGAYVSMSHSTITVGNPIIDWSSVSQTGELANFYLATYNGDSKYFSEDGLNLMENAGLNALSVDEFNELFGNLGANRPMYNGHEITVEDTVEYVADPALLKRTFARAFAVIDSTTWDSIKSNFSTESNLHDYLRSMFAEDVVEAFVKSNPAGWSERRLEMLTAFAKEFIESDGENVLEKEGTNNYNLTVENYATLKDTYALQYLVEAAGLDAELVDASLYNLICELLPEGEEYTFCFTKTNIELIKSQYGIDVSGNDLATRQKSFDNAVGVPVDLSKEYSAGFAGTIVGTGTQLVKTGTESLVLTGKSRYSGNTIVQGGELRIDYDAIQSSQTITVNKGALLTIVSEDNLLDEEGNLLPTAQFGTVDGSGNSLIRGEGTLLKDGVGTLEIVSALAKNPDNEADDFTGAIIVGKDTLQIDITTRKELKSDLYINEGATLRFELQGTIVDEETGERVASNIELTGALRGNGTLEFSGEAEDMLVFSDGDAIAVGTGENSVKLSFVGVTTVIQLNGVVGSGDDAYGNTTFRDDADIKISEGAVLTIEIASRVGDSASGDPLEYTYDTGMTCAGTFVVSGTGDDPAGVGRTLILTRAGDVVVDAAGEPVLDANGDPQLTAALNLTNGELQVTNKAILQLADGALMRAGTVTLMDDSETVLWVDGTLKANNITIASGSKLASTGVTNGRIEVNNFVQNGGDVDTLPGTNFAGTLAFFGTGATLTFNTAENETLHFGASIEKSSFVLEKDGAGTVVFEDEGVSLDFTLADVRINAGTLEMWQDTLEANNKGYHFAAVDLGENAKLIIHGNGDPLEIFNNFTGAASSTLEIVDGALDYESNTFEGSIILTNSVLRVGENVTEMNAVGGSGTVEIARDETCKDLTILANGDVTFTGTIAFSADPDIEVEGNGIWSVSDGTTWATFENVGTIKVGGMYKGGIGIATKGKLANDVEILLRNGAVVALVDDVSSGTVIEQSLTLDDTTKSLTLRANGSLDFYVQSPSQTLNLGREVSFSISNFNGDLTLNNISSTDVDSLSTYGTGSLILASGEYDRSIGGNGNVKITGTVSLLAESQAFTGTFTVAAGAKVTFKNTTMTSTEIIVEPGATLVGGLTTAGTVIFGSDDATALYSASVAEKNVVSAKTISGRVKVQLLSDSVERGQGYQIFQAEDLSELVVEEPTVSGTAPLMVIRDTNNVVVYVSQDSLASVEGASYHKGLGSFLNVLSDFARPDEHGNLTGTDEQVSLGYILNTTSSGALDNTVELLSPLAYASMVAMPAANFANDQRAISQRLEQRLSDNTSKAAVWEYNADWEFFAQAQGTTVDAGTEHDSMVFDFDTFGVLAGTDRKFSHEFTAGFAVAYDHGKADIHHSGGKIEADDLRVIGFTGLMINDSIAVNLGAEIGFASYDIKRRNGIGNCKDDTTGFHGGLFAEVLTAIPLIEFIDGERIDLLPHAGLALGYYNVGSASESGLGGLDVDRFDALSLQARVGAELAASFTVLEYNTRATFDISLVHEFLDDEVEIDAKIAGRSFSTDARAMSQTSLSLAPGVMVDLDPKTSVYLNYEFRAGTESIMTHSVNVGFRHRF